MDAYLIHRLQFAFTIMFHYLFPGSLEWGLALLIVILKIQAYRKKWWIIEQISPLLGKDICIKLCNGCCKPVYRMEFQFGVLTGARFSAFAGGIIGQTLAMEGVVCILPWINIPGIGFCSEKKKLGPKWHLCFWHFWFFWGSWYRGFFIIATNAWMQNPVGINQLQGGEIEWASRAACLQSMARLAYVHNMSGAVVTACFVMSPWEQLCTCNKSGWIRKTIYKTWCYYGSIVSVFQHFPAGDGQGKKW